MARQILSWNGTPITYNHIPLQFEPPVLPFLSFYTESSAGSYSPFAPLFTVTNSGVLKWDLADGSIVNANIFSHTYANPGDKYVKVYDGSSAGPSSVSHMELSSCDLVGTLNLSNLINLNYLLAAGNQKLTHIVLPDSSIAFQGGIQINSCNIQDPIDLTKYIYLAGPISLANNPIKHIYNPTSAGGINNYDVTNCGILGTLDMSTLTHVGGAMWIINNPGMTKLINPQSTDPIYIYYAYALGITSLDCSGLTGMYNTVAIAHNPSLNTIVFPNNSNTITNFTLASNDLFIADLSSLTGLGGGMDFQNNHHLTQIINPSSNTLVSNYFADYCDLTGTLDMTGFKRLGGYLTFYSNPHLTQIINPPSSELITAYYAYECDLTGTLDLSRLTGFGGGCGISLSNNPHLTGVKNSSSNGNISNYAVNNCNITGTLDVSGYTDLGGNSFHAEQNPLLTKILNPTSSQPWWLYVVNNCDLTGDLDISGYSGGISNFEALGNAHLTSITLPATITRNIYDLYIFDAEDCSLNLASVDNILAKYNAHFSSLAPTRNFQLNLHKGHSSWPTNGYANSDIVNLYSVFATAGHDVSININIPPIQLTYMTFQTEASTNTFDPVFTII